MKQKKNNNNKTLLYVISGIGIFAAFILLVLGIKYSVLNNFNKLKADISYPTSNGIAISCTKDSIAIGEETTCTITGFLDSGCTGVAGLLAYNNNVEKVSITKSTDFVNMGIYDPSDPEELFILINGPSTQRFIIGTITVRGASEGTGTIEFKKMNDSKENVEFATADGTQAFVNGYTKNITVTSSSTPDPTPGPDPTPDTPKSNVKTLSSLKVNGTEILSTLTITLTDATEASISATPTDSKASVSGTGRVTLRTGNNSFDLIVTAEDGTTRTYTINIVNNRSGLDTTNTLNSLTVTNATLSPIFSKTILNYSSVVKNNVSSVVIAATPTSSKASVSGDTGEKSLTVGPNRFSITVTAENGSKKTYTLNIEREDVIDDSKSSDNTLKKVTINGKTISLANLKYNVPYETSSINIVAEPNDTKATVGGDVGNKELLVGKNLFNIIVTAENNSKRTYTVEVTRAKEQEADAVCEYILRSDIYIIDNKALTIGGVSTDHSVETIRNNITSDCGSINVTNEKVLLNTNTGIKEYTIKKVWMSKTGQEIVKYTLIILTIAIIIGGLVFVKIVVLKDKPNDNTNKK